MKKRFFICTIAVIMFVLSVAIYMPASEVKAADINYTISYNTTVKVVTTTKLEGNGNDLNYLFGPEKNFNADITDPTVISEIENFKKEAIEETKKAPPNSVNAYCSLIDGFEYNIPADLLDMYCRFFELPANFNGTKTIEKEGVIFIVTGNGKGRLSVKSGNDFIGTKEKIFTVPEEKTYTINERFTYQEYSVSYYIPNSSTSYMPGLSLGLYSAKTLDEILEHCAQNAALDEPINISVMQTYSININAFSTYRVNLQVYYGNTKAKPSDNTTSKPPVTQDTSSDNNSSSGETIISSSDNEQTISSEPVESDIQSQTDEIVSENESLNENKKNSSTVIIILCIVVVLILIASGVLIALTIIKKKRN